ncbi:hypothetical protein [Pontibacillus yanchengensis]|nr:hypothetical protein [Pontibacillus yanchengensis]
MLGPLFYSMVAMAILIFALFVAFMYFAIKKGKKNQEDENR